MANTTNEGISELFARSVALAEMDQYVVSLRSLLLPWLGAFVLAALMTFGAVATSLLGGWIGAHLILTSLAYAALGSYTAQPEETRLGRLRRWQVSIEVLVVTHGLLWGAFVWFSLHHLGIFKQFLVTWILVVSAGLGAVSLSTGAVRFRGYLATALGLVVLTWALLGNPDSHWMALSLALVALILDAVRNRYVQEVRKRLIFSSELVEANELLKQSNFSKTRLIVEASHDLRQPVHALGMMLDRINVWGSREEIACRLREVQNCVDTVSDMLIDLLDLSRLESGEYVVDLQPVHVGHLLSELDQAYGPVAQRKGLAWIVLNSSDWVLSDPAMLKRVMNNLISNAIKYTSSGTVSISCRRENNDIQIRVQDTGSGIPKSKMDVIFREYVRLDNAIQEPGYGIGLAVVRRMLDLLGHGLNVKSVVGQGSRFSLTLQGVERPVETVAGHTPDAADGRPWLGRLIVFIENDEQLRKSTAEVLTSWGAQVVAASSVAEAMQEEDLYHQRPDLVISDMHLDTEPDGLASIEVLRKEYPFQLLPAILLTGDLSTELQLHARRMEVRIAYKPVRPSRLREMVSSALLGQHISEPMSLNA